MIAMTEIMLYEQIAQYLNLKYPDTLYHFDLSGIWTPSHKARNLYGRLNRRAWPDLFIARESSVYSDDRTYAHFYGLFLEIKREGTRIFKKNGDLVSNPHIFEQWVLLEHLREQGYAAYFACGYDEAIKYIDDYLGGNE